MKKVIDSVQYPVTETITAQPGFSLLPEHLNFAKRLLSPILKAFDTGYSYNQGMDFQNMYPITYEDGVTGMMVKQPRLDVKTLIADIQTEERAALKLGITEFAPSYLVDGFIVQKLLVDDNSLSAIELSSAKEAFFNTMKNMTDGLDGISPDNVAITAEGPVIIDVRSCGFSKVLAKRLT